MKNILGICLLLLMPLAHAGFDSGVGKITMLYMKPNANWVRINFSKPIKNEKNCGEKGFYIAELDDSRASDRFYSALLAAHAAQRDVSFWISGCSDVAPWGSTRPKIYDTYLR